MGQAILRHRVFEGARDVGLADQIVKRLRPIFSRENFVAHALNLNALIDVRKYKIGNLDRIKMIF